jgi:hypothetical protein
MSKYYPPIYESENFHCPNCSVYARQIWHQIYYNGDVITEMNISYCSHCNKKCFWFNEKLVIPDVSSAPTPHVDLPSEVADDYNEAASILNKSPRGSAALLRLALQKLMIALGQPGKDINKDIGSLVIAGLPVLVQQALDIVRVIGNESVHPGQLDMKDDTDTAVSLFELINFIVEDRISRPKQINELYLKIPEGKRKGIEQRDKVKTP